MKRCNLCGKEYDTKNKNFCSKECYCSFRKRKPACFKYGKGYIKPVSCCLECGRGYIQKSKNHKFCSNSCWDLNWNKRNPDYYNNTAFYKIRFLVLERDGFKCVYCGRSPKDGAVLQLEHISPRSKGGENSIVNYVSACAECNLGKGDYILTKKGELYARGFTK